MSEEIPSTEVSTPVPTPATPDVVPAKQEFLPIAQQLDLITKGAAELIPAAGSTAPDALITQHGRVVDGSTAKGPVRLRLR